MMTPEEEAAVYNEAYKGAYADAMKLKVKELRTELAARNTQWADCLEKEELAGRLAGLIAKSAIFSPSGALVPGAVGSVDEESCRVEMADPRSPLIVDVYASLHTPLGRPPLLTSLGDTWQVRDVVRAVQDDRPNAEQSRPKGG